MLNKVIKNENNKEVFLKSIIFFVFKVGGFFLGYFFTVLITRNLGKSIYGLTTIAFTVFMIVSVISKLGFDINLTRLISSGNFSKSQIRSLYLKAVGIAFFVGCFFVTVFIFYNDSISLILFKNKELSNYLFWAVLAIPFWSVVLINAGIFRGFKKNSLFSFFNSFGRFGIASLLLFGYILLASEYNPEGPLVIHLAAIIFLAFLSTIMVFKTLSNRSLESESEIEIRFKPFIVDSFPILVSSAVFILLGWMDRIFLGIFETENEVALFDVSAKIALIIGFSLEALNSILAPKVSELYYAKKTQELQKTILFTAKINGLISLLMFLIILFFSEEILSIFGGEFKEGKWILIILSIGQFFNCISGSVGVILQMTGNQKSYRLIMLYALILNVILNLILIRPYGVFGVAIATASSMIIWNLIGVYLIRKKLLINSFIYTLKT